MLLRSLTLLACVTATAAAAQTFEGAIGMTVMGDDGRTMPLTYLTKGGKIRFDMSAGDQKGGIVIDPAAQKMLIIMDEQKMYMEMPVPGSMPGRMGRQGRGTGRSGAARTGRTETIAGYHCEHVTTIDDDGASVDSCVTSELGSFRMFASGGPMQPPQEEGWATGLGAGSFPLKVQKGDKILVEVTKVQRQTLEASLFTAPAGYRKFAMPGRGGS